MKNIIKLALLALGFANSPIQIEVSVGLAGEETYTTESPLTLKDIKREFAAIDEKNIVKRDVLAAKIIERNPLDERYVVEFIPEAALLKIQVMKLPADPVEIIRYSEDVKNKAFVQCRNMYLRIYAPFILQKGIVNFAKLQTSGCLIAGIGASIFFRKGISCYLPFSPQMIAILESENSALEENSVLNNPHNKNFYERLQSITEAMNRIWEAIDKAGIEVKEYEWKG